LVPILFLDTGGIVALDYVADQMANGNGDGEGYLPAQQAEPRSCAKQSSWPKAVRVERRAYAEAAADLGSFCLGYIKTLSAVLQPLLERNGNV
jgi:hypothetical protein